MTNRGTCEVTMSSFWILLLAVALSLRRASPGSCQLEGPMACSTIGSSCPAYLYYTLHNSDTLAYLASLFSISQSAIKQEDNNWNTGGVIASVQCLCSDSLTYVAEAAYRVSPGDTQASIVAGEYEYLARVTTRNLVAGQLLQISLLCGCTDSVGQPLLTYVAHSADTLEHLAVRFNTSLTTIRNINNVTKQDHLTNDMAYYVPIHDSALKPAVSLPFVSSDLASGGGGIALGAIVGIVLASLLLIAAVAALVFFLQKREVCCYKNNKSPIDLRSPGSSTYDVRTSAGISISQRRSKGIPGNLLQCGPLGHEDSSLSAKHRISSSLSKDMMNAVFGIEKPIIFGYDEIVAATSDFAVSNHIGVGAYGSVYFGLLRDQEVAIKKIKAAKTKAFFAELKALCKVHHTNLVELIGYSISDVDLFLVYEYAENGAVSDRLHDPHLKGFTPLRWNARVQIALDTARGLEYIHEHTTAHNVHRAVNTSNILLDGYFRAKVADFGLAKLVEQSQEGDGTAINPVGTFGYLAPECVRDGQATDKSDVYAFGIVLFELITGEGAILKNKTSGSDTRSPISLILSALNDPSYSRARLKAIIDPLLQDIYSLDSVLRMATLGRQCVEEDPQDRPDMKRVALALSQILLACIEWEATLAGNIQAFSGLIQGR